MLDNMADETIEQKYDARIKILEDKIKSLEAEVEKLKEQRSKSRHTKKTDADLCQDCLPEALRIK